MALYESYLDEDYNDEAVSEAYDLDEDYLDEGAEDYDEAGEDFDEARRRRRSGRRRRTSSRRGFNRGRPRSAASIQPNSLRKAFNYVGDDVNRLRRKTRMADDARTTALGVDIVSAALLAPKIEQDAEGNITIKDNLVPLIAIKLLGNSIGSGSSIQFKKVLPYILIALLLSPNSLKQLGLDINNRLDNKDGEQRVIR